MNCPICNKSITDRIKSGGSPKKFCSVNCRVKNYRLSNKEKVNINTKKYHSSEKARFQMRVEARLRRAVAVGKVIKPKKCSICRVSDTVLHGHHSDYSKPLDVIWVCPQCHVNMHKNWVQIPTR